MTIKLRDILDLIAIALVILSSVAPLADLAHVALPPLVTFGVLLVIVGLKEAERRLARRLEAEPSPAQAERIAALEAQLTETPPPVAVPPPPAREDGETLPAWRGE